MVTSAVPQVVLTNVSKQYGSSPPVLQQIDLSIAKGEFVSLIGPSGCGKSTLLKLISGLSSVSSGSILVDGMTPVNARETISFIFQDATLLPWRTVTNNVGLGLELEHVSREARKQKVESLLELVGLTHVARSYPRQLSGGMKMRVSVARALAIKPRLLLMDEPFGALDAHTRTMLQDELLAIWERHTKTVLFVTHAVDEAVYLADRVLLMTAAPGRIKADIPITLPRPRRRDDLLRDPRYQNLVIEIGHLMDRPAAI